VVVVVIVMLILVELEVLVEVVLEPLPLQERQLVEQMIQEAEVEVWKIMLGVQEPEVQE
jgi:hypothetical protein